MLTVMRTVSPEKSTKVARPGVGWAVVPVVEMATANFCGCAAGPTGVMALTTGREVLPQPIADVRAVAAKTNLNGDRRACGGDRRALARYRTARWCGRDWVFASASILAKCKTTPAMVLVLAMLKVDCKSLREMRLGDG